MRNRAKENLGMKILISWGIEKNLNFEPLEFQFLNLAKTKLNLPLIKIGLKS